MEVTTQEAAGIVLNDSDSFETLVSSKTWAGSSSKPSRVIFDSPGEFFNPYMEHMEGFADFLDADIIASTTFSHAVSNKNTDDSYNTAYGRARVEFKIPEFDFGVGGESFTQVFGVIYAFDLASPEIVVYSGRNAHSCLNLHVFNAANVYKTDYLTGTAMAFQTFQRYAETFSKDTNSFKETVERLMNTSWSRRELNEKLGRLLVHVVTDVSFGTSALNHAVKLLHDPGSRYAVDPDGSTTPWNVLQALTQYVTDKTPLNIAPTKTHQMAQEVLKIA